MTRRLATLILLAGLWVAVPASAQTRLTLPEAIARARSQNFDVRSAAAAEREAAERVTQARAGYFPKVDVTESWQRGNQPVFVFSSLLAQRRLTEADFALDALNHPAAIDNFRAAIMVQQSLLDRAARANVRPAGSGPREDAVGHAAPCAAPWDAVVPGQQVCRLGTWIRWSSSSRYPLSWPPYTQPESSPSS